jgi:hypothetical protein
MKDFLSDGFDGGRKAAQFIISNVTKEFGDQYPSAKIWITVFANVEGLSSALGRQGHITRPIAFHEFVKGFNDAAELVSFVDVGYGKELADVKIKSTHFF